MFSRDHIQNLEDLEKRPSYFALFHTFVPMCVGPLTSCVGLQGTLHGGKRWSIGQIVTGR